VAPVIDADGKDVASSIAFTAVLGIVVVLALPLVIPLFSFSTTIDSPLRRRARCGFAP